jgi:putative membrane protein
MIARVLVCVVALLHLYFLVLEMFLWRTPRGLRTFRMTPEKAEMTAVLAKNQGLYNGFLAAGLIWSLWAGPPVAIFFLVCVLIAGIYGGITASRSILFVQALPAVIALVAVWLS